MSMKEKANGLTVKPVHFYVMEMPTRVGTFKLEKASEAEVEQAIEKGTDDELGNTSTTTALDVLQLMFDTDPKALINPAAIFAKGTSWYDGAMSPDYKKGGHIPKFKHDISVAKVLAWLEEEDNNLTLENFYGKAQIRNPASLKAKRTKAAPKRLAFGK